MSITQTYFLAHKARGKLSREAARPDHNLRLVVGHANLLDSLMLELADAEREQEAWYNQSVRAPAPPTRDAQRERHIQWADSVVEEPEADWDPEDAESSSDDEEDSDFDEEDEDVDMVDAAPIKRVASHKQLFVRPQQIHDDDLGDYYDDENEEDYTLVRTPSHSASSPPELDLDSDSDDDELSMPPSPPTIALPTFSDKEKEAIATTGLFNTRPQSAAAQEEDDEQQQKRQAAATDAFYHEGFYLPPRGPARIGPPSLVSAISVY